MNRDEIMSLLAEMIEKEQLICIEVPLGEVGVRVPFTGRLKHPQGVDLGTKCGNCLSCQVYEEVMKWKKEIGNNENR